MQTDPHPDVTHVIVQPGSADAKDLPAALQSAHLVTPDWLAACLERGKRQPEEPYAVVQGSGTAGAAPLTVSELGQACCCADAVCCVPRCCCSISMCDASSSPVCYTAKMVQARCFQPPQMSRRARTIRMHIARASSGTRWRAGGCRCRPLGGGWATGATSTRAWTTWPWSCG